MDMLCGQFWTQTSSQLKKYMIKSGTHENLNKEEMLGEEVVSKVLV